MFIPGMQDYINILNPMSIIHYLPYAQSKADEPQDHIH